MLHERRREQRNCLGLERCACAVFSRQAVALEVVERVIEYNVGVGTAETKRVDGSSAQPSPLPRLCSARKLWENKVRNVRFQRPTACS